MNFVYLKGIIKNIGYSHTIGDTVFNKADLIVNRNDGRETNLKENSEIELCGNVRSYSRIENGRHKVEIYVFTYFDTVEIESCDLTNIVKLSGKICKKDELRVTSGGKHYIHFIVANNLEIENNQRLNSYVPCVAWGKLAKHIDKKFKISDDISLVGRLQSREYKKKTLNDLEIRVAHEVLVTNIGESNEF